jgi:hypothetical protein
MLTPNPGKVFCVAFILFFVISFVFTAPVYAGGKVGDFNFNETTGLINIPVARVQPTGSIQASVQAQDIGRGKPESLAGTSLQNVNLDDAFVRNDGSFRVIWGAAKNIEVSGMLLHGGLHRSIYGFKWLAVPGGDRKIAFAVGAQSIGMKNENNLSTGGAREPLNFTKPGVFGVASYTTPLNDTGMSLDLHAGIGTQRLKNPFGGVEFHFSPQISVIGEHDGTINSVGMRLTPDRRWDVLFAAQLQKQTRFGLALSYRFGNTGETKESKGCKTEDGKKKEQGE